MCWLRKYVGVAKMLNSNISRERMFETILHWVSAVFFFSVFIGAVYMLFQLFKDVTYVVLYQDLVIESIQSEMAKGISK